MGAGSRAVVQNYRKAIMKLVAFILPFERSRKSLLPLLLALSTFNHQPSTAHAQSTVFSYQGRVTDNGTNFTGMGEFKFALVTSTNHNHQATATANLTRTFVTTYSLTYGGNGYVAPPAVHVAGGGGSGATATATIGGGVVTAINPGSAGSGYTVPPTVTIDPPPENSLYITYWSNDGTSSAGSEPGAAVTARVNNGLFALVMGDTSLANMTAIDASLFLQPNLQLRIWFNDGLNGFAALSPVQDLAATPYAAFANTASNLNGTLADSHLSSNVGLLNANQSFSGSNRYSGVVQLTNAANTIAGTFTGKGSGLTGLNPTNLSAGTAGINISGNAVTATTAANASAAVTANNFSGSLVLLC
jgi:hypothetical protein